MRAWWLLALALAPGLAAAWQGRRLVSLHDDAALPERLLAHRQRRAWLAILSASALGVLAPGDAAWTIPLLAVAVLAGSFPARRHLLGETWGFPAYVAFLARVLVAFGGFWLLLALAPVVLAAAGPRGPGLDSAAAAALLIGWSVAPRGFVLRVLGARPLDQPALRRDLAELAARARVPSPDPFEFGPEGGCVANAFALPSLIGRGAVVFTRTLLERFEPREVLAIHAHELAHLEHFTRLRLAGRLAIAWTAVFAGVFVAPAFWRPWAAPLWFLGVLMTLAVISLGHQSHEADSDRRAVALCGDAEALAAALIRLHALALAPRRLAPELERRATHPSLARRLRAIRAAAGQPAPEPPESVAFPSSQPGRWVIFAGDRAFWLEDVPAGTAPDPVALREAARVVRATPYAELAELRVRPQGRDLTLAALDRRGQRLRLPIAPEHAADLQAALDRLDSQTSGIVPAATSGPLGAVLALTALLLAVFQRLAAVVMLPLSLLAAVRQGPATVLALATTTAGYAWLAVAGPAAASPPGIAWGQLALALALAAWAARMLRETDPPPSRAGVTALVAGASAAVSALAVLPAWFGATAVGKHRALAHRPSLWVAMLALSAAAFVARPAPRWRRLVRAGAAASALLGVLLAAAGSPRIAARWLDDPLLKPPALPPTVRGVVRLSRRRSLPDTGAWRLHAAPGGERLAYWSAGDEDTAGHMTWLGPGAAAVPLAAATDLRFLASGRALVLTFDRDGLRLRHVDENGTLGEVLATLPDLDEARLDVDPSSGAWRVTGADPDDAVRVAVLGDSEGGALTRREWRESRSDPGETSVGTGVSGDAASVRVVLRWPWAASAWTAPLALLAAAAPFSSEVWLCDAGGVRRVAEASEVVECRPPPIGGHEFVCLVRGHDASSLWRLDARAGRLAGVASFPGTLVAEAVSPEGRIAAWAVAAWRGPWGGETGGSSLLLADDAGPRSIPAPATGPRELVWAGDALLALESVPRTGAAVAVVEVLAGTD